MNYFRTWLLVLLGLLFVVPLGAQTPSPVPAATELLRPASDPTTSLDVTVNGQVLPNAHYLERDGALLFPPVAILQALHQRVIYDPERHTLTVEDKSYPIVLDPDVQPPTEIEEDHVLYVGWSYLHAILPPLHIGMGREGVVFSAIVAVNRTPRVTPIAPPADLGPAPSEDHTTYYVNVKDKRHHYHVLGCKLLATDPNQRYEVQDPETMNFMLREMYGNKVVPFIPCPECIKAEARAKAKAAGTTPPTPQPGHDIDINL